MTRPSDAALRLQSLQAISVDLSEALDAREVARVIVRRATVAFGGLSGSLCVVVDDGETFELVDEIGYAPETDERWQRFPVATPLPAGDALRARAPIVLRSVADRDVRYPVFAGTATSSRSFIVLPLLVRDRALGVFTIGFSQERDFSDDDLAFFNALAALCAQALHRTKLVEAAEAAAARVQFLADASNRLNTSLDTETTLDELIDLVVPGLADGCAVLVWNDDGPPTAVARSSNAATNDQLQRLVQADTEALATMLGVEKVAPAGAPHAGQPGDLGVVAVIPMVAAGRAVGGLALLNDPGRVLLPESSALAQELAARAGTAVTNAHQYLWQSTVANTLQQALLPPSLPHVPGLELAARYIPMGSGSDVGGDFYDVVTVDGGRWLLVIGDVCGKGVAAARHTALVRHAIRAAAVTSSSPGAILSLVNRAVARYRDDTDPNDDTTLCTACVVALEPVATGGLLATVGSAGHPPPLLLQPTKDVQDIGTTGPILGVFDDVQIPETTTGLLPGTALVLHTDGITDRHRKGRFFGREGLVGALPSPNVTAGEIADALLDAATSFVPGGPSDDMAIVVAKVLPPV